MGRVKAMLMDNMETLSSALQEEFILGSITEEQLIYKLEESNYWSREDVDDMVSCLIDEKDQYEIDSAQHGVGA